MNEYPYAVQATEQSLESWNLCKVREKNEKRKSKKESLCLLDRVNVHARAFLSQLLDLFITAGHKLLTGKLEVSCSTTCDNSHCYFVNNAASDRKYG